MITKKKKCKKVLPLNRVVIDFKEKGKSIIKAGGAINLSNKAKEDAIENFKILQQLFIDKQGE